MSVSIWDVCRAATLGLMLLWAAGSDVMTRRIPNQVVALGSLAAMGWALSPTGPGLVMSLLGGMVAFLTFLALHALGWMGAGDVKLAGAAGLYFGPAQAFSLCLAVLLMGGLVALVWYVWTRNSAGQRIPYGVAIGLGAAWHAWHPAGFEFWIT